MRLIDADELKRKVSTLYSGNADYNQAIVNVLSAIDEEPTIDPTNGTARKCEEMHTVISEQEIEIKRLKRKVRKLENRYKHQRETTLFLANKRRKGEVRVYETD